MTDLGDSTTFKCSSCEQPLTINRDNPPNDDDIVPCQGCGKEFGTYAKVKDAQLVLARAEFDSVIAQKYADLPFISLVEPTTPNAD